MKKYNTYKVVYYDKTGKGKGIKVRSEEEGKKMMQIFRRSAPFLLYDFDILLVPGKKSTQAKAFVAWRYELYMKIMDQSRKIEAK